MDGALVLSYVVAYFSALTSSGSKSSPLQARAESANDKIPQKCSHHEDWSSTCRCHLQRLDGLWGEQSVRETRCVEVAEGVEVVEVFLQCMCQCWQRYVLPRCQWRRWIWQSDRHTRSLSWRMVFDVINIHGHQCNATIVDSWRHAAWAGNAVGNKGERISVQEAMLRWAESCRLAFRQDEVFRTWSEPESFKDAVKCWHGLMLLAALDQSFEMWFRHFFDRKSGVRRVLKVWIRKVIEKNRRESIRVLLQKVVPFSLSYIGVKAEECVEAGRLHLSVQMLVLWLQVFGLELSELSSCTECDPASALAFSAAWN